MFGVCCRGMLGFLRIRHPSWPFLVTIKSRVMLEGKVPIGVRHDKVNFFSSFVYAACGGLW